ncbi:hypothetical protein EAH_00050500, partial [Eimeria acervulina]
MSKQEFACGVVSTRRWQFSRTPRAFAASVLQHLQQQLQQQLKHQLQQQEQQNAPQGEKLRFVTSGFMRLLVMRRSPASGILCRIAEAPMRNAAIAAESQLFRWPGVKELLNSFNTNNAVCRIAEAPMRNAAIAAESQLFRWPGVKELLNSFNTNNAVLDSSPWKREQEKRQKKKKAGVDLGARRQGLMRIVEWGDNGNPWNCRGLVEQEVFVQEGDFFVIADE